MFEVSYYIVCMLLFCTYFVVYRRGQKIMACRVYQCALSNPTGSNHSGV